jgi:hypothetical protein
MKFPEQFRTQPHGYKSNPGDTYGVFVTPYKTDLLFIIATDGTGYAPQWEHVSVSVRNRKDVPLSRCPTWEQMHLVKTLFWDNEEAVMQLHPPASQYVNAHPFCLHLWRPAHATIPLPPSILVGPKT